MKRIVPTMLGALQTAAIGFAGAAVFLTLHVPAGSIVGAILATATVTLAGRRLTWPPALRTALFLFTGYSAGASATPAALTEAMRWPASLLALAVCTVAMWGLGVLLYRRLTGSSVGTAFFATAPGAFSTVLALSERPGVDIQSVTVAQISRLLFLVCLSPLASVAGRGGLVASTEPYALIQGPWAWLIAVSAVLAVWRLGEALRWPAAAFMGGLAASLVLHLSGLVDVMPSPRTVAVVGALLGAFIGSRFSGVRLGELKASLPACLALVVALVAIGAPVGAIVGTLVGVGPKAGLLAFSPGSMEVMVSVALQLDAHPAYVAIHHLARTLLLVLSMPVLALHMEGRMPASQLEDHS